MTDGEHTNIISSLRTHLQQQKHYHCVIATDEQEHQRDLKEQTAHAIHVVGGSLYGQRVDGAFFGFGPSGGDTHQIHTATRASIHWDLTH